MSILEKINFRQPKYMLPAILYLPLLGTSYFVFDLFRTGKAEVQDTALQTTEFLNPELPEATIRDEGIGSKYENMTKSWGRIQDYTAVDNIERDEPDENKEEYESKYTEDDIALLGELEQEKSMAEEAADAKTREEEALAELEESPCRSKAARAAGSDPACGNGHGPSRAATGGTAGRGHHRRGQPGRESPRRGRQGQRGSEESQGILGLLPHARPERPGAQAHPGHHRRGHQGRGRLACASAPAGRCGDRRKHRPERHLPVRHGQRLLVRACERQHQQHPCG